MAEASNEVAATVDEILIGHIRQIIRLEQDTAESVLDIYKRVRQELRDRLDVLPPDRFQAQQVRGVLAQVEQGVILLQDRINDEMTAASFTAANQATGDIVDELSKMEKTFRGAVQEIRIDQTLVAESTRALKIIQYESSVKKYGAFLTDSIQRILVDATVQQKPFSQVVREVAGATGFIAREGYRVERLVRTELHSIYDLTRFESLRAAKESTLSDLQKMSVDPLDDRTALDSIAVRNQIKDLDAPFRFKGQVTDPRTGESKFIEVKPFMNHPNRPNDRGVTAPYRKVWENRLS